MNTEIDGSLAHAVGVLEGNWPHTMDAQVWAQKWIEAIKDKPDAPLDEGFMIGWFANAIMAGYDTAYQQVLEHDSK